jgi:LysM repeat protein
MMRGAVHSFGLTLVTGLLLFTVGCAGMLPARPDIPELRIPPAPLVRDRGLELAALRSEMAATKIAAAKKEAELLELRDLVRQLRLENAESRQAFLELRDQAEQRQRDLVKARETPERQAKAQSTDDLTVLKDTVVMLAQELGQLKQDLAKPVAKEPVKLIKPGSSLSSAMSPMALTVTAMAPDAPSTIMVQPGDTLVSLAKRHRTTVEVLRKLNVLNGDTLIVGRALVLPMSQQP